VRGEKPPAVTGEEGVERLAIAIRCLDVRRSMIIGQQPKNHRRAAG
jgi:hypothetical protein